MSIYDVDIANQTVLLLPPTKRKALTLQWLGIFGNKLQYLHDLVFGDYLTGNKDGQWQASTTYTYLKRVRYRDNAIYEVNNTAGVNSIIPPPQDIYSDTNTSGNWIKVQDNFIGLQERVKYNSQKLVFEFALNKWFNGTFRQSTGWDISGNPMPISDIFISAQPVDDHSFVFGVDETDSSAIYSTDTDQLIKAVIGNTYLVNSYAFSINIPTALYDATIPSDPSGKTVNKDNKVRAFADNYALGSKTYNIILY